MKIKLKKYILVILIAFGVYLIIGNLLHRYILPEKKPDVATYFKPGLIFHSKLEGVRQIVQKQEKGFVYCTLELEPLAGGPPNHIHDGFDETFEIENGELSVWVNGEIKKLHPGEQLTIKKGTPHKPFNLTNDTIRLKGSFAFPEKFAFNLCQVYGFMKDIQDFESSPKIILQMLLFQGAGFDSYIADGPPVVIQKIMDYILSPLSRLFGLKSYYAKYDPFIKPNLSLTANTTP